MKMHTNNKMVTLNKKQKKNAYKVMEKEIDHILRTFDYSNYEIAVFFDEKKNTTIVPKPVFALSFINEYLRDWVINQINLHPNCTVRTVQQEVNKEIDKLNAQGKRVINVSVGSAVKNVMGMKHHIVILWEKA